MADSAESFKTLIAAVVRSSAKAALRNTSSSELPVSTAVSWAVAKPVAVVSEAALATELISAIE